MTAVYIAGILSSVSCVSCGVPLPQGSVLGPLIFLIYINDIGNAVSNDTIKLFVDDTNLCIFGDNIMSVAYRMRQFILLLH